MSVRTRHSVAPPTRWLALGLAALVLTLGLLTAAPAAHEHLHGPETDHGEHSCAVVLFAHGVILAGSALALVTTFQRITAVALLPAVEWVAAPARLLPPACGPPTS